MRASSLLTREQCTALKGVAILSIVLHNFCHLLFPEFSANEYEFAPWHLQRLLHMVQWQLTTSPAQSHIEWLPLFLSSHFEIGVYLFLFLSGYGLVMKHESDGAARLRVVPFMAQRYFKLLRLMLLPFIAAVALKWWLDGRTPTDLPHFVAQIAMVINLLPSPQRFIFPGPYWFLGMIMEMYLLYAVALHCPPGAARWRRWLPAVALAVYFAAHLCLEPRGPVIVYLRYNVLLGIMPFTLGVLAARRDWSAVRWRAWWLWLLLAAMAVALWVVNRNYYAWLLMPAVIVTGGVCLMKLCGRRLTRVFTWLGTVSAALFVTHPIVRMLLFDHVVEHHCPLTGTLLYLACALLLATAYHWLLRRLPRW